MALYPFACTPALNCMHQAAIPVTDRQKDTQTDYVVPSLAHAHQGIITKNSNFDYSLFFAVYVIVIAW